MIGIFDNIQNPISRSGVAPKQRKRDPLRYTRGCYIYSVTGFVSAAGHGCKSIGTLETDSLGIDILISDLIVDISTGYVPPYFRVFMSLIGF